MRVILFALVCGATAGVQVRDAAQSLAEMRRALGGDAVLDAIRTFTVDGSITISSGPFTKGMSLEVLALLPDHFMRIQRDWQQGGPIPMDITYFHGFAGDVLIRRTESTLPFPPDPGPQTPEAMAQRGRDMLLKRKQEFARMALAFFGTSVTSYPLQFTAVGADVVSGRAVNVIEARSPDGFVARLVIDASTHLPALIVWQAPPPVHLTTSSTAVVRGSDVISRSPPAPVPAVDPAAGQPVAWRLELSDFKTRDGVTWPHRLRVLVGDRATEDMRLGRFRLNPKIDPRRFDIAR